MWKARRTAIRISLVPAPAISPCSVLSDVLAFPEAEPVEQRQNAGNARTAFSRFGHASCVRSGGADPRDHGYRQRTEAGEELPRRPPVNLFPSNRRVL